MEFRAVCQHRLESSASALCLLLLLLFCSTKSAVFMDVMTSYIDFPPSLRMMNTCFTEFLDLLFFYSFLSLLSITQTSSLHYNPFAFTTACLLGNSACVLFLFVFKWCSFHAFILLAFYSLFYLLSSIRTSSLSTQPLRFFPLVHFTVRSISTQAFYFF